MRKTIPSGESALVPFIKEGQRGIIEEGRISMVPIKLAGIWEWPVPTTVKQVQSFLGFGNFYWVTTTVYKPDL